MRTLGLVILASWVFLLFGCSGGTGAADTSKDMPAKPAAGQKGAERPEK
jgi:hypothetical protein